MLLIDDVLATGGTAAATRSLVEECGAEVHAFANDLEASTGTHLYGRRMYETMSVWQTLDADPSASACTGGAVPDPRSAADDYAAAASRGDAESGRACLVRGTRSAHWDRCG